MRGSRTAHTNKNGVWSVNKSGKKGYHRVNIPVDEIYEFKGEYHTSKDNPVFSTSTTTVKAFVEKKRKDLT